MMRKIILMPNTKYITLVVVGLMVGVLNKKDSFPHLLIEDNIHLIMEASGRTGLDYLKQKVSEVYEKRNHRENQGTLYMS